MTVQERLRVQLVSAKGTLRRRLDGFDNEEVRWARKLVRMGRADSLDVLHLGNSTVEWIDPDDVDRRPLHTMIRDELASPTRYLALYGGSYDVELHDAYLKLALAVAAPKVVLVPLWYRGRFRPWREHPVFSRDAATRVIAGLPADVRPWQVRAALPRPTPQDWARYQSTPFDTFAGLPTVGDHTRRLKDPGMEHADPQARAKLFFAYHLSHRLETGQPELEAVTRLGERLRDSGVPVVAYENPVPIDNGVLHWGERFREVAGANFAHLAGAFRAGYGHIDILNTGMTIPPEEFLDPGVADEHLNECGRRRLRDAIVGGIARVRPDLVRTATTARRMSAERAT